MIEDDQVEQLRNQILGNHDNFVYAVIDGAACPQLRFKLYDWAPEHCCLYSGKLEPDMEEVAPYLVKLQQDSIFTNWLIKEGWDNHWSIFVESELDFKALRKQIRKLLLVKSPEGETLVFRFYDPRVMSIFLPTCDGDQADELFDGLVCLRYQQEDNLVKGWYSPDAQSVVLQNMVV